MFVFIYDKNQKRVIHYASDAKLDFLDIFNQENQREFYTNEDVSKFHFSNIECDIVWKSRRKKDRW
jgi:hypothetical protein